MLNLAVIVPTIGRPSLVDTLASIPEWAQVIVVADGGEALDRVGDLDLGRRCYVTATVRTNTVGHDQRNLGMLFAAGVGPWGGPISWLGFIDDDDTYTDDAFEIIRAGLTGRKVPHIFQMRYINHDIAPSGLTLWSTPGLRFANVGTPMFIVPNIPRKLPAWPPRRGGDYEFVVEACKSMGGPEWCEGVIAHVRPQTPSLHSV